MQSQAIIFIPTNVIQSIRQEYAKRPPQQQQRLELEIRFGEYSIPPTQSENINPRTGRPFLIPQRKVTNRTYQKLIKRFNDLNFPRTITHTTDYRSGDVRKTFNKDTQQNIWIRKQSIVIQGANRSDRNKVLPYDNDTYKFRVSLSEEIPIDPIVNFRPDTTREKNRTSYHLPGGIRIDLTEVTMTDENNITQTSYEVEMEVTNSTMFFSSGRNFDAYISMVLSSIQDTQKIYTQNEYFQLVGYVNTVLGSEVRNRIDESVIYQARNLHFKDLVYGGLVGNPNEIYKVTWKTDGIRKLLVVTPQSMGVGGIWLVMAPDEVNLLIRLDDEDLAGTILEGEYVPIDRRFVINPDTGEKILQSEYDQKMKNPQFNKLELAGFKQMVQARYWFLAFDALARPSIEPERKNYGDSDIRMRPHHERMVVAQGFKTMLLEKMDRDPILKRGLEPVLEISIKRFRAFNDASEFFEVMREYNDLVPTLQYENDGYIFMPDNMPYDPSNSKRPLSERVLTKYPDILKYKPPEQLTIDFTIVWKIGPPPPRPTGVLCQNNQCVLADVTNDNNNDVQGRINGEKHIELYASQKREILNPLIDEQVISRSSFSKPRRQFRTELVLFEGTERYPYMDYMVDSNSLITRDMPSGTVVEYRWDYNKEMLVPVRIRTDKMFPNGLSFAKDNWNLIREPIQLQTLLGNNIVLLRKYHNRIKRDLFEKSVLRYRSKYDRDPYLLDIGSGRGGDISKWNKFGKIVSVEPNVDHIYDHLIPRILKFYPQQEVTVITDSNSTNDSNNSNNSNNLDLQIKLSEAMARDDKVIIINTGGENTELITEVTSIFLRRPNQFDNNEGNEEEEGKEDREQEEGEQRGKADVISMMLSLSFFWKSPQMLNSLIETIGNNIASDGEFNFLTIDGDAVEEMFDPKFGNGPQINYLLLGPPGLSDGVDIPGRQGIQMQVDLKKRQVKIDIPGSIVEDQLEYLVRPDDLRLRLAQYQLGQESFYRADKEGFLNGFEMVFTKMFSYGRYLPSSELSIPGIIPEIGGSLQLLSTRSSIREGDSSVQNPIALENIKDTNEVSPSDIVTSMERLNLNENQDLKKSEHRNFIQSSPKISSPQHSSPKLSSQKPSSPKLSSPQHSSPKPSSKMVSVKDQDFEGWVDLGEDIEYTGVYPTGLLVTDETISSPPSSQELESLYVSLDPRMIDRDGRARGDDVSQTIRCQWYNQYDVVRIATIGDGSCFIHAVLKGYLPTYADNPSLTFRIDYSAYLRRDLAYSLQMEDPDSGKTFYDSFQNGAFPQRRIELGTACQSDDNPIDYSLPGLQNLFNSRRYLGEESFKYVGDMLGVKVIINLMTTTDIIPISDVDIEELNEILLNPDGVDLDYIDSVIHVFIGGNNYHYETLGIYMPGRGIKTTFTYRDPFLIAYYIEKIVFRHRAAVNTIILKIRNYQVLTSQDHPQLLEEVLYRDQTFKYMKDQLNVARQLYQQSLDIQNIARNGSDLRTLQRALISLDEIEQISEYISSIQYETIA